MIMRGEKLRLLLFVARQTFGAQAAFGFEELQIENASVH